MNPVPTRHRVVVAGNPNTGKSTLFAQLTRQKVRIGNYPGVTVERRSGPLPLHLHDKAQVIELVDLPGAYSLCARSPEEQIALNAILGLDDGVRPCAAVVVLDATQVSRSLYVALQLLELDLPVVLALNLIDEANGESPTPEALSQIFGVPCIATNGRTGEGVEALRGAIEATLENPQPRPPKISFPQSLESDVDAVVDSVPAEWGGSTARNRALALWALNSLDATDELVRIPEPLRTAVAARAAAARSAHRDIDAEAITARYAWIDEQTPPTPPIERPWTERVDKVLLHPVWGFAIFLGIMFVLFQSLFAWADPAISLIEGCISWLSDLTQANLPPGIFTDFLTQGVLGGVGAVVVFLPQILLLFLFIGIMEDSGYMARAAFLMDRIMRAVGLNGRAFVPMLSGFACAVPAIMATRTMDRQRDRLLTMMTIPLMSCSARLPVYTLIIAALFPASHIFGVFPIQGLLMVAMYLFSTVMALGAAAVLGRTVVKGGCGTFVMELPPYRPPVLRQVLRQMWERSRLFLSEAGGVILICTVVLWGLLSFPQQDMPLDLAPAEQAAWEASALERSWGGQMGKAIEPVIAPLGFDWKIGVGIIGAFAAREVFVSTMGLVYGVGAKADEKSLPLREHIRRSRRGDGGPATPLMGLSLMVFFALAAQCMSTLAVIKRETGSWRWPLFTLGWMTALAWIASFVVYQGGRLLGFG